MILFDLVSKFATINYNHFNLKGGVMTKVTREMVEKAGVNVKQLVDLLVKNAAAELTTYYYYTILRVNLIGLGGEGLKEIVETARIEDRNHFEAIIPRIYELEESFQTI